MKIKTVLDDLLEVSRNEVELGKGQSSVDTIKTEDDEADSNGTRAGSGSNGPTNGSNGVENGKHQVEDGAEDVTKVVPGEEKNGEDGENGSGDAKTVKRVSSVDKENGDQSQDQPMVNTSQSISACLMIAEIEICFQTIIN